MSGELDDDDRRYLGMAVELSRSYRDEPRRWPFGAVLVGEGRILGQGSNQVVELRDPSAHAEIMALRAAGRALGQHAFEDSVLYSSSEPCPMCLAACYWARLPRLVFAATSHDVAANGFEDLQLYREMAQPVGDRSLQEDAAGPDLHAQGAAVLQAWADQLPHPIVPKL
jgi:tRNA(Arg) A34 adenosine deaminase TadA